jgi:ABC-type Fe3+/spermidine/putrescine transport system ATPase subunit
MGMSDRIALLNAGRIQQVGKPEELYERPANRFVADFIGRNNVLEATVGSVSGRSAMIRFANGRELTVDAARRANGVELAPNARIGVCLRAESLRVTSGNGTFQGVLTDVEYVGAVHSCVVKSDVGNLKVEIPSSNGRPAKGESVRLEVVEGAVHMVAAG